MSHRQRRSRPRIPRGVRRASQAELEHVMADVDVELAVALGDDPALGLHSRQAPDSNLPSLPVALFEPRRAAMMSHPDGSAQELQVEAIIQAGFSRWRPVVNFEQLPEWTVRQTRAGLELWEGDGIWACGTAALPARWRAAADDWGQVLVLYGTRLGVRPPAAGARWTAQERAADLRVGRRAGWVAAALVTWKPLPIPDKVPFEAPSYDSATGRFRMGRGSGGEEIWGWQLNAPGEGVRHGLIIGDPGIGKTNVLRIITVEAVCTGKFVVWHADPTRRHDVVETWGQIADRIAESPGETALMLEAAAQVISARLQAGGYADPTPDNPGLLILIDDCQAVFAGNPQATQLAERIVTTGGSAGVGLIVTARGADPAYFGGSRTLRSGLGATNRAVFGTGTEAVETLETIETPADGE
jgi:hypothetical protein